MIECNKCIHYPVCDHSRDYFKYDECAYYSEEPRQHGEWILDVVAPCSISWFRCSYCGYKYEAYKQSNFCPNCGAKMEYNTKDVPDPVSNLIYHPEYEFHKCTDCQKYHNGTCNRIDENNEACGLWKEYKQ